MAQKTLFAIVALIACFLAFAPAEVFLYVVLSNSMSAGQFAVANLFGVTAGAAVLFCLFKMRKLPALCLAAIACTAAALPGWSTFFAAVGGGFLTVMLFIIFVIALILYEDMGAHRKV